MLPHPQQLQQRLTDPELEKQYRIETTAKAKYVPQNETGLWLCTCGRWNSGSGCTNCKVSKEKAFSALETSYLTTQTNRRLEHERIQHEEALAEQARLQAETEVKRKTICKYLKILASIVLILAVIIGIGLTIYGKSKELTIEKMLALYTKDDAITLFGKNFDPDASHEVTFLDEAHSLRFNFEKDTIQFWILCYDYPALRSGHKVTDADKADAKRVLSDVSGAFTKKYGPPEVSTSSDNVTTFTWIVNDRMIKVNDHTQNNTLGLLLGAFDIEVNCNYQSFCEHANIKTDAANATCTDSGYMRETCTACGYIEEEIFPALGHTLTKTSTKAATCSDAGEIVSTCSVCGDTVTETIEILPHTYKTKVTKTPSCVNEGIQINTCSVCGDICEEAIPTIAHTYVEDITKAPSCISTGTKSQKCTVCSQTQNSVSIPALGHDYKQHTLDKATCVANGTRSMKCTRCGDTYTETISALGHAWSAATCTSPETCSACGETKGTKLGHTTSNGVCKRCGYNSFKTLVFSGVGSETIHNISFGDGQYDIKIHLSGGDSVDQLAVMAFSEKSGNPKTEMWANEKSISSGQSYDVDSYYVGEFDNGYLIIDTRNDKVAWRITISLHKG